MTSSILHLRTMSGRERHGGMADGPTTFPPSSRSTAPLQPQPQTSARSSPTVSFLRSPSPFPPPTQTTHWRHHHALSPPSPMRRFPQPLPTPPISRHRDLQALGTNCSNGCTLPTQSDSQAFSMLPSPSLHTHGRLPRSSLSPSPTNLTTEQQRPTSPSPSLSVAANSWRR